MLNELDNVKSARRLSGTVAKDCVGTVVMVYDSPSLAYEVEFLDANSNTVGLLTVQPSDITPVNNTAITQVESLVGALV
jgi:hypothetical protein